MPYVRGKLKGLLKPAEIRKIIRLHNELSKIKIPPRLDRDGLIKFVESKGFKIDHENMKIVNKNEMKKELSLKEAQEKFPTKSKLVFSYNKKKKKEKKEESKKEDKPLMIADKPVPPTGLKKLKQIFNKYKDRNWKKNIISKMKPYLGESKTEDYYDIIDAEVKNNKIVITWKYNDKGIKFQKSLGRTMDDLRKFEKQPARFTIPGGADDTEPNNKTGKSFKVERTERSQMINQLSQEIGKRFNPFKILGIKASEETPELVKKKCRELKLKNHPDKGGDKDKFDLVQKACDVLLKTQTKL